MRKIVLASSNKHKIKEIQQLLQGYEVISYCDIMKPFDIIEDGNSFKQNAIIKAKAIYERLDNQDYIVISDDSGISVEVLNNEPNIYSARYAGQNATDLQNNQKLINKLREKSLTSAKAFYTACICMIYKDNIITTHGWMHGKVIDKMIGDGGFGYDCMFIPKGYDKTLGQLDSSIKQSISHRTKALKLIKEILQ